MSETPESKPSPLTAIEQFHAAMRAAQDSVAQSVAPKPSTRLEDDLSNFQPDDDPARTPSLEPVPEGAPCPTVQSDSTDEHPSTAKSQGFKMPQRYISLEDEVAYYAPEQNIAVLACIRAWNEEWDELELCKASDSEQKTGAAQAYLRAMPPLSGRKNIRDFIACVTKGLLVGAIGYDQAPKLLYAAQIAHTASEVPTRPSGRPRYLSSNTDTASDH